MDWPRVWGWSKQLSETCFSAKMTRSPKGSSSALLPFFGWEGSPTKIDYIKKGTLILTSLLEDLDKLTHEDGLLGGD